MRRFPPSATLMFHQKIREHVKCGKEVISLGLGEAEVPTPKHIVEAGVKALRDGKTKYSASQGLPSLRELISRRLQRLHGIACDPDKIIVTPGAKNALFLACISLLQEGDEVVLLRPCYVSNLPILHLASAGITVREVDMIRPSFDLDKQKLADAITDKTRLLLINSPNNPTGQMLDADAISYIGDLLLQHPDMYLLSDEIYEAMTLGDRAHVSPASISAVADRVITVGGFSKTYFMTGWRIGYVHASAHVIKKMLSVHQHINSNTAEFIQYAAIAALEGPQECVADYITKLAKRRDIYYQMLERSFLLRGTRLDGGYFTFIDVASSSMDGDSFAVELLARKGVAIVPGLAFGASYSDYCRLSFVNRTELFREGLKRIQELLEELCSD